MGLLDNIGGMLAGGAQGGDGQTAEGQSNAALGGGGAIGALGGLLSGHAGGLPGMIGAFQRAGLGGVAASWISNEANQGVTGDQVRQVLGDGPIAQYAEKLGITPDIAAQQISHLLPQVIDHLTPNGEVPQGGSDMLSGLLNSFRR